LSVGFKCVQRSTPMIQTDVTYHLNNAARASNQFSINGSSCQLHLAYAIPLFTRTKQNDKYALMEKVETNNKQYNTSRSGQGGNRNYSGANSTNQSSFGKNSINSLGKTKK